MIQWGILGAGKIARRFISSLSNSYNGQLYAVASLTESKRVEFHKMFSDIQIYDDYTKLLDDPKIDAVYIAMRHKDHYQWAKEALKRKKAVLCEKPATLSYQQTKELCELSKANETFFMEAMKTRFVPLINDIKELLDHGEIGDILRIETCFAYKVDYRPGHYLHEKDQGGILNDVGSYNLASILDYIHSPIKTISSWVQYVDGVDANDIIELTFESGQTALIEIAFNENKEKKMTIYGTLGKLIANPFYRPESAMIILNDGEKYVIEKKYINDDFYTEIEEVHQCLQNHQVESFRMKHQDSLNIMKVIENIRESFQDELNINGKGGKK